MNDRRQIGLVMYRAGTDAVAKAAFFAVTVAAARTLSQSAFGLFSLASTVGWMAAVASDFGIQMHLARAVAQQPERAGTLLGRWLPVRVLTAAVGVVAVSVGAIVALPSWPAAVVLILLTLTYAINGLTEFIYYFFRGIGRSDLESSFVALQRLVLLALALAALTWTADVTALALAMLVPAVVTLGAALTLARRLSPLTGNHTARPDMASEAMAQVVPIGAGIVLSALYFRIDIFMIGAWLGTEAAGMYNSVFRIVEALRLLPAAALAVVMPLLFTARTRQPLLRIGSVLTAGGMVVAVALWFAAGPLVPWLYGERFADAVPALRVLALSFPLMALNYALTHQLIGWHGHRRYAWVCAAALVINVVANALAIPRVGITGAAWTTLATELAVTVLCLLALASVERRSLTGAGLAVSA